MSTSQHAETGYERVNYTIPVVHCQHLINAELGKDLDELITADLTMRQVGDYF